MSDQTSRRPPAPGAPTITDAKQALAAYSKRLDELARQLSEAIADDPEAQTAITQLKLSMDAMKATIPAVLDMLQRKERQRRD